MSPVRTVACAVLAAPFVLALVALPIAASPPPAVGAPILQGGPDTVRGTIRTLDLRGGSLSVTTGVGMALRVVQFRITTDTRAADAGTSVPLTELQAGDVVRVTGGARPEGRIAYMIERIATAPRGRR
jgi:hypothetical protein